MFRRSSAVPFFALAAALATGACDSSTTPGSGRGFTLLLTDAPGDFQAAVVTISQVSLQGEGSTVLVDEPFTVDLLDLRNQISTVVQNADVPAGQYSELRLVIDGAYIQVETENGGSKIYASSPDYAGLPTGAQVDGQLHMPSMGESGLKINLPGGNLEIGEGEVIVLIDFDVSESFGHEAGDSGQWVMHPVIKATDVTFGGYVLAQLQLGTGVVLPQLNGESITLADFTARLTPTGGGASRDLTLADTDADNVFEAMFKGVAPGTYDLTFIPPTGLDATYDPTLPRTVTVVARETSTETITLTAATATTAQLDTGAGMIVLASASAF